MSFLLSRRWLVFATVVALAAWGTVLLGQWQFHRLHDRKAENRLVRTNLAAPPVPLDRLMRIGHDPSASSEWRRVTAHGRYDDRHAVVLKYQTSQGQAGVHVVTPLVTAHGQAVLVDRGWLQTTNTGGTRPKLPPSVPGSVTVTGYVRVDATGDAAKVSGLSTRAISSREIAQALPYDLYGGFLDLDKQAPRDPHPLGAIELPDDTSNGPHFFYGLQWWFFGCLAVFGFFYLLYDEWTRRREESEASQGAGHAPVDREHQPGQE